MSCDNITREGWAGGALSEPRRSEQGAGTLLFCTDGALRGPRRALGNETDWSPIAGLQLDKRGAMASLPAWSVPFRSPTCCRRACMSRPNARVVPARRIAQLPVTSPRIDRANVSYVGRAPQTGVNMCGMQSTDAGGEGRRAGLQICAATLTQISVVH